MNRIELDKFNLHAYCGGLLGNKNDEEIEELDRKYFYVDDNFFSHVNSIYNASKDWHSPEILENLDIFDFTKDIIDRYSVEEFLSLRPRIQESICYYISVIGDIRSLVEVLELAELNYLVIFDKSSVGAQLPSNVAAYLSNSRVELNLYKDNHNVLSRNFWWCLNCMPEITSQDNRSTWSYHPDRGAFTGMLILRALYGEESIINFWISAIDSQTSVTFKDFVKVAPRYDEFKDMPIDWVLEIIK